MLFPDEVEITYVIRDQVFKSQTLSPPKVSKAYVEDDDKISNGSQGDAIVPKILIFLPKNTVVNKGDLIKVTKLRGKVIIDDIQRKVTKTGHPGGHREGHVEVECTSGN